MRNSASLLHLLQNALVESSLSLLQLCDAGPAIMFKLVSALEPLHGCQVCVGASTPQYSDRVKL